MAEEGARPASRTDSRGGSRPATREKLPASQKKRKPSVQGFWEKETSSVFDDDLVAARGFRREAAIAQVRIARMITAAKQIADLADALAVEEPEKDPAAAKQFLQVAFSTINVQDQAGQYLFGGAKKDQAPLLKYPAEEYAGSVAWEIGRLHRGMATSTEVSQRLGDANITPMQLGFQRDDFYGLQRVRVGPHTALTYGILADAPGFQHVLVGAQVLQGLKKNDPDELRTMAKSLLSRGVQELTDDVIGNLEESFKACRSAETAAQEIRSKACVHVSASAERPRTPTNPGGLLTITASSQQWMPPKRTLRATLSAAELSMRARRPVHVLTTEPLKFVPPGPWPFPLREYGGSSSSEFIQ